MPRRNNKSVTASSAVKKRWTEEQEPSFQSTATMTETKSFESQATQTIVEAELSEETADIGTAEESYSFVGNINQQLAALPVRIGLEDENINLKETVTNQVQTILTRYGHDLSRATTKTMQVLDCEFHFMGNDFLEAAFESQVCDKCNESGNRRVTRRQENAGILELELTCMKCQERKTHKSDSRVIFSRFRPKSWLPNYVLLSFFLNGEYFKDYEHVLGTLGVGRLSESQWLRVVKWLHPAIKELTIWSCEKVKSEIVKRGDKNNLQVMYDGFYATRGYHSNNSTGTIHDEKTGKVIAFAHRTKRGAGSNWSGTSGGAEGDIFEELLASLKEDKFNIRECIIDHDATCANVLLEIFPEADVIFCGNHTVKTFHTELTNVKKIPCQVSRFLF